MPGLPEGWRVVLGAASTEPGAIVFELREGTSLSLAFWKQRLAPGGARPPLGPRTIALPSYPTFDDVWLLWMLRECEVRGTAEELPASWEAICMYADQARQGFFPDRVAPDRAVQSVLRSVSESTLAVRPSRANDFIEDALALCALVAGRVGEGKRILDDDLVGDVARFQPHVAVLREDRRLYGEDRRRGRTFDLVLPASHGGVERKLAMLVLDRPLSRMFKTWARRDAEAPGGEGYALLLTRDADGEIVLSADPALRVDVAWLAAPLTSAERKSPEGATRSWYAGARHVGTLVASPREGTSLSLDDVVHVLGGPLRLRKEGRRGSSWVRAAIGGALVAGAAMTAIVRFPGSSPAPRPKTANEDADTVGHGKRMGNDPLPPAEKINLFDPTAGVHTFTPYAIVIGVCTYTGRALPDRGLNLGTEALADTCNDAWELAHVLVRDYQYDPKHVVLMIDDKKKVEHPDEPNMPATYDTDPRLLPTASNLERVLEYWSSDHPDSLKEKMTLLFFYSGHGETIRSELPYLAMANWEADIAAGKTVGETGFPMEKMETLARTYIPAKHALFLFDNCHAGWALSMGEGEESEIERRWASGVKFGIAAAPKDGFAHDPEKGGFSIFSRYVIDGLSLADGTPARADKIDGCGSADHIVTHEELLEYLKREVPAAMLRELKGQEQVPTGRRYDDSEDGQFLFVAPDAEKVLKDRHCDAGQ